MAVVDISKLLGQISELGTEHKQAIEHRDDCERKLKEFTEQLGIKAAKKAVSSVRSKTNKIVRKLLNELETKLGDLFVRHFPDFIDQKECLRIYWKEAGGHWVWGNASFAEAYSNGTTLIAVCTSLDISSSLSPTGKYLHANICWTEGDPNIYYYHPLYGYTLENDIVLPTDRVEAFLFEAKALLPDRFDVQMGEKTNG